jgi:hypothetical protein
VLTHISLAYRRNRTSALPLGVSRFSFEAPLLGAMVVIFSLQNIILRSFASTRTRVIMEPMDIKRSNGAEEEMFHATKQPETQWRRPRNKQQH